MWIRFRHWNPNRTKIDDRNWPPWNLNCQWFDSEPLMVLAYNRSTKMMTGMSTQLLLWVQATGRVSHPRRNLLEATDTETNYQRELTCIFKYIMQCMHIAVFFFNIYWCEHEKQVNKVFQIKMSQISVSVYLCLRKEIQMSESFSASNDKRCFYASGELKKCSSFQFISSHNQGNIISWNEA